MAAVRPLLFGLCCRRPRSPQRPPARAGPLPVAVLAERVRLEPLSKRPFTDLARERALKRLCTGSSILLPVCDDDRWEKTGMNVLETPFFSAWGNFENWLNSSEGWIFYLVLFVLILSILANWVARSHRLDRLEEEPDELRTGFGRTLAVIGGFITLVAQVLPWETWVSPAGYPSSGSLTVMGLGFEQGLAGVFVSVFGLVWLTCFAIPKEAAAILGLLWGSAAFILTLLTLNSMAATAAAPHEWNYYIEYGVYASILGSLLLIAGSVLVYRKMPKATKSIPSQDLYYLRFPK